MIQLIDYILNHKATIGSSFGAAYLAFHRIYTYVVDKGGIRMMWSKFIGPKQTNKNEISNS